MSTPDGWQRLFWIFLLVAGLAHAQGGPDVRSGVLTVLWGDPPPGSSEPPRMFGLLTGAEGETARIELTPELLSAVGGTQQIGYPWIAVTLRDGDRSQIRRVEALHAAASPSRAAVQGSQPWISILCKFSDISAEPRDLSYFQGMYGNAPGGLDHYWRQASFDHINIAGSTAANWVTLPHPRSHYFFPDGGANLSLLVEDCTAAADPQVDFSNGGTGGYVGINMMFNADLDCCAWGGGTFKALDGVEKAWRTTWVPRWGYENQGLVAHEMGHGFGLPHSNNSDADGSPYDSPWDVMSDPYGYSVIDPVYGPLAKHTISHYKDRLGWIPAGQRFEALRNGSYTFTIDSLAAASTSNYRMATIRMPGSLRSYTVESRKHEGHDGALAGEAVLIHEVVPNRSEPAWLVDADLPPADYSDNEGVMWRPGETFTDPSGQLQVTVDGATGSGFDVTLVSNRSGTVYEEGFESGSTGFSGDGLWHPTAACAAGQAGHSRPTAFYFGIDSQCDYANGQVNFGLLSPPDINLAGLAPPVTLTFNYFLETDPGSFALAQLYIQRRDGSSSDVLASNKPAPGVVALKDPSGGWQTASIDLQPYVGSDVLIYFWFYGDPAAGGFDGFYVDDIAVWSCFSQPVLSLTHQGVASQQTFRACDVVTAGQDFHVAPGGDVQFRAGKKIVLEGGFSVAAGGTFTATIGPPEQ